MQLILKKIKYKGFVNYSLIGKFKEEVKDINCKLNFGNIYCFNSELSKGGWAVSWIIAGLLKPNDGIILYNDKEMNLAERKKMSQCVGRDDNNISILAKKTIKNQILDGIKRNSTNTMELNEIIELFKLDKEKIDRKIKHVSAMRFKASMAIGYANGKQIYCFPWMEQKWIFDFKELWLKYTINILKSKNYLILIPTKYSLQMKDLFDEVINV